MFRRVLIANRGEVAARVLRTCQRMGIETVAVFSEPDRDLSYLAQATEAVCIGDRRAYLDQDAIIGAALATACSAVHPGWGFLAENPTFAARCEAARVTFVGPRSGSMRLMADKAAARATMKRLGVAPIPGTDGIVADVDQAAEAAEALGYPVLLKALAGGGGRGMRRVERREDLAAAFQEAAAEAGSAFGNGALYLEKLIERGRHIELQVFGGPGLAGAPQAVVLGERDCSIQRRHQKLIEETPSPSLDSSVRRSVAAAAAEACRALGYRGAGTIEMLADADGHLWFMEMNTRLQVEHTITEAITGVDLVEWQLRVAANQRLPEEPRPGEPSHLPAPSGHAIECRINAEDPRKGFRPEPGRVSRLRLPEGEGIRVDTHLADGDRVSPHYDSMIAKVIATGPDRQAAISRMDAALARLEVDGLPTTAELHRRILAHPVFQAGTYDNGFLERELEGLLA